LRYSSKLVQSQAEHYGEEKHLIPVTELNPSSLVVQPYYTNRAILAPYSPMKIILYFVIEEKSTFIEDGASTFL
jgi:hypothetical protein